MKISRIFIEDQVKAHPRALKILSGFPQVPVTVIRKVEDVFGSKKKPYLQKRETLNLFIGRKEGEVVKPAPDAYGLRGDPHYYFTHAYNCIYECEYCYLQGYFHSPDLVFFINHEEIGNEMIRLVEEVHPEKTVWFHAGEFSDSLALSHMTGEWPFYFDLFSKLHRGRLELRTKSVNISAIKELKPSKNILVTYSLSPDVVAQKYDRKTPPIDLRLKAIKTLSSLDYAIGIHFDPIIYFDEFERGYEELIEKVIKSMPVEKIEYVSLGVVRFSKQAYREVEKNYPTSELLAADFTKVSNDKIRYPRPLRVYLLNKVKNLCLSAGIPEKKIYLCMEKRSSEDQKTPASLHF